MVQPVEESGFVLYSRRKKIGSYYNIKLPTDLNSFTRTKGVPAQHNGARKFSFYLVQTRAFLWTRMLCA